MRPFTSIFVLVAIGGLILPALGDDPDPKEIIAKADQATQAVSSVSYKIRIWGEGALKDRLARIRATVMAKDGGEDRPPYYRIEGSARTPGVEQRTAFHVVYGETQAISINEKEKECLTGDLRLGFDLIASLVTPSMASVTMSEFLRAKPFADELEADSLQYEGPRTIGGVGCHTIYVTYKDGVAKARWYIGVDDYLPRRVDRVSETAEGPGVRVSELFDLDVAPKFDETTFATEVPAGFVSKPFERPLRSDPRLLAVNEAAPEFALKTPAGETVSLSSLRGKVVVLTFWVSWKPPCVDVLPHIQKLHERYQGRPVVVFGVNLGEPNAEVDPEAFLRERGCTYDVLLGDDAIVKAYRVSLVPATYIIGPDGKVLCSVSGYDPYVEPALFRLIEEALP